MSTSAHALVKNSIAWNTFTVVSWVIASLMMAGGIWFMDAGFSAKGFYSMSALMLVHTTIAVTKTFRENEEQLRLHNRIDEARTERLLMEVGRSGNL